MNTTPNTCAYEGCDEPLYDGKYCVFHAPDKLGMEVDDFNRLIFEKIRKITEYNDHVEYKCIESKDYNFKGYIFPGDIYIDGFLLNKPPSNEKYRLTGLAKFSKAEFNGNVELGNIIFECTVNAFGIKCSGHFLLSRVEYLKEVDFTTSIFSGEARFTGCVFTNEAKFNYCLFKDNVLFDDNTIKNNMLFTQIKLEKDVIFDFLWPTFNVHDYKKININFENVVFNPFAAKFDSIKIEKENNKNTPLPILIFRYCQLKDVYFMDNDISLFSFYKSSFDQARFISCQWGEATDTIPIIPCIKNKEYYRKNIIREEKLFDEIKALGNNSEKINNLRKYHNIEDLTRRDDIAALYRQMKAALDHTKDYQEASWFYFNEFEMKRKTLEEEIESKGSKLTQCWNKLTSKYILYFCYKVFAGYGEKPIWSFCWFVAATGIFNIINMFAGLKIRPDSNCYLINYDISLNSILQIFSCSFWCKFNYDFWQAMIYTLSRVIPISYLPIEKNHISLYGDFYQLLSFCESIALAILIIFIGIGLKRHFRRF